MGGCLGACPWALLGRIAWALAWAESRWKRLGDSPWAIVGVFALRSRVLVAIVALLQRSLAEDVGERVRQKTTAEE